MIPSTILGIISRSVLPTVGMFSVFLLVSGHNDPGGGFIGGLVAGAGFVLVWAVGGAADVRRVMPVPGSVILGIGLLLAQLTAVGGWVVKGSFLESAKVDLQLPVFGEVHLASPMLFDLGVYVVVVGLVITVLTTLGAEEPAPVTDPAAAPEAEPAGGDRR